MRFIYFLALFAAVVYGVDSVSKRIHVMEKFMLYFNYQIETLLFVKAITTVNKQPFNFAKPPLDLVGMRKKANVMEYPKTRNNAQKWLDNRRLMPSIPEAVPSNQQYAELYRRTSEWTQRTLKKIDELDDEKKTKAKNLMDASEFAVGDMDAMRYRGFLNQQLADARAKLGSKAAEKALNIPADRNGGLVSYREINWAYLRSLEDQDFVKKVTDWVEDRNKNNLETSKHIASRQLTENLRKCY